MAAVEGRRGLGHRLQRPPLRCPPDLPWAQLLRRAFAVDVMVCAKCRGRLRVIQVRRSLSTARGLA
jgi:hypothetical protein